MSEFAKLRRSLSDLKTFPVFLSFYNDLSRRLNVAVSEYKRGSGHIAFQRSTVSKFAK